MAYQNETVERNVYEEMGDNRQPPSVYANVTPTRHVSPLDKGVSRRVLLIGLLVPTLVALGAVCAVVVLVYTQQARLEESVKDLAARVESLESKQLPQNEVESVQLLRIQGELLRNLSTRMASLHTHVVSNSASIQNLSDQMALIQGLRTQETSLLDLKTEVKLLQNITNQDECQDHPCANGWTCVDGINAFWCLHDRSPVDLTLEQHLRQITASTSIPSKAVDKDPNTRWLPGREEWMSWIQVDFLATYTVHQIDVMLGCYTYRQPSSYRVTLSDGSTQEVSKACPPICPRPSGVQFAYDIQALYTLSLEPRATSSIRLQPTARCDESVLDHSFWELVIWGY